QDIVLNLTQASGVTTIAWASRPQSLLVTGYDMYSGTINSSGDPTEGTLSALVCAFGNIPQPSGAPGPIVSRTDAVFPALNKATFFLVGHNPVAVGGQASIT